MKITTNKICVLSGGGAWGAEKVGVLHKRKENYDIVIGVSTGALQAPLVALGEYDLLSKSYTSVSNKDIFSYLPYNKKGKMKRISAAYRALTGRTSIGDSSNLLKTIRQLYTPEMHKRLQESDVVCEVARYSFASQGINYVSSDMDYNEFTKAMWHSANAPFIMSFEDDCTDAGIIEVTPLRRAYELGSKNDTYHLYICRGSNFMNSLAPKKIRNMLDLGVAIHDVYRKHLEYGDLVLAKDKINEIPNVFIHWKHPDVNGNALIFNKVNMLKWWEIGHENAELMHIQDWHD